MDELTAPYASVIDIKLENLPRPEILNEWNAYQFHKAIVHDQTCAEFNPDLRQLIHAGYKVVALKGEAYYSAPKRFEVNIEK